MGLTTDRNDSCIYEIDSETGMQRCYLILPEGRRKELVRPIRRTYIHEKCGTATTMSLELAQTYAADPNFYSGTYCAYCRTHFPVGTDGEFIWQDDRTKVGS